MYHFNEVPYKKCYEGHPLMDLGIGVVLYGGSCLAPIISQADIYVGLETNMATPCAAQPWKGGCSVSLPIPNMKTPIDEKEFMLMVEWIGKQLLNHKEVHVGCIGGHGRTGLVLSALKYLLTGDKLATEYIRQVYCKKAVETVAQVDFLHRVYGIDKVAPVAKYKDVGNFNTNSGSDVFKSSSLISHLEIIGNVWD